MREKRKNLFDQDIKDTYGKRFRKKTEVEKDIDFVGSDIWLEMYANSAIKIMRERKKYIHIYIYIYITTL